MRNDRFISDLVFLLLVVGCGLALQLRGDGGAGAVAGLEGRIRAAEESLPTGEGRGRDPIDRLEALRGRLDAIASRAEDLELMQAKVEEAAVVSEESAPRDPARIEREARGRLDGILAAARDEFVRRAWKEIAESVAIDDASRATLERIYREERSEVSRVLQQAKYGGVSGAELAGRVEAASLRRVERIRELLGDETFERVRDLLPDPPAFTDPRSRSTGPQSDR